MKPSIAFLFLLFVSLPTHAQQWVTQLVTANPKGDEIVGTVQSRLRLSVGTPAPPIEFRLLVDSTTHTLKEYAGHTVLLNLWGTNCSGCRMEMPMLSGIADVYANRGILVLFLSSESSETLTSFFAAHPLQGVKGIVDRKQMREPYQMLVMPATYLVDPAGVVRDVWLGPATKEKLEQKLAAFLTPPQ